MNQDLFLRSTFHRVLYRHGSALCKQVIIFQLVEFVLLTELLRPFLLHFPSPPLESSPSCGKRRKTLRLSTARKFFLLTPSRPPQSSSFKFFRDCKPSPTSRTDESFPRALFSYPFHTSSPRLIRLGFNATVRVSCFGSSFPPSPCFRPRMLVSERFS